MAQMTRIIIVDSNDQVRSGLRALLGTWPEINVVGEAANGRDAVQLITERRPDVVLMDLAMPGLDGVETTRLIKQHWPTITVIALTMYAGERVAVLAAGADAFLLKRADPEELLTAILRRGNRNDE